MNYKTLEKLDTAQPCHLLKPNWKPSSSHSICILTNISTLFLLQSAPLAEVINILRSFLKCTGTCTIGTLHLPRNQSLFYESFNGTFRWEILHSKTIKGILHSNTIKGIFKGPYRYSWNFRQWSCMLAGSFHWFLWVERASLHDLRYGMWSAWIKNVFIYDC